MRTRNPPCASTCAQAQPVTPPPTTATSTAPSELPVAGGDHVSESQYELVMSSEAIPEASPLSRHLPPPQLPPRARAPSARSPARRHRVLLRARGGRHPTVPPPEPRGR